MADREMEGEMSTSGIDRVMRIAEAEPSGDHYLSHLVFAWKVLREPPVTAIALAKGYRHRWLMREECEGLVADWREEGWL
jgi:hypothetical protein